MEKEIAIINRKMQAMCTDPDDLLEMYFNKYLRARMTEPSFARRILPPERATDGDE